MKNYTSFKALNPKLPFLLRPAQGIEPYVLAEYGAFRGALAEPANALLALLVGLHVGQTSFRTLHPRPQASLDLILLQAARVAARLAIELLLLLTQLANPVLNLLLCGLMRLACL